MRDFEQTGSSSSSPSTAAPVTGFAPWQWLKTKRISYLTLPLLFMATVTEFVILATGWKYQQVVCVPQGMGVTFLGIGPIGATILAVELLKLPLAIWTASRQGWQKGLMLVVGLPCICLLTFQLVKDMAVYEMGVALTPAAQMLEKASVEETKIAQLNGQLTAIEAKKSDHQRKLTELAAREAKAKADFEESLKRNEELRHDAINLTDYQKKELSEVESREASVIAQFNADTAQLNKSLADLRARREVEVTRAAKWNAEQARIDNAYNVKMTEYANKKAQYEREKADFDNANFLKRQLMKEPAPLGAPPEREVNTILKPAALAEIDSEIKAKEAELLAVNNKRRDRVAQIESDAQKLRQEYDQRSTTKREDADRKRDELLAAQAASATQFKAERHQIDQELAAAVQNVDGIRAQLDAARKTAEGYYEAREAAIRKTQVHRIATTVEIIRGLIKGERPMSIKMSAKERGDILTDQISMVRIWVYPVLAFIVAFLPTLMVEIGFSTVFQPESQRPTHRLGFLGRRLHELEVRAGRQKILAAERLAAQASAQIASRDTAWAAANAATEQALAEKEAELQRARQALTDAVSAHAEELQRKAAEDAQLAKAKEEEWVGKLANMAEMLNRTAAERDELRDLQKSEVERQVQMRQKAWSDRLSNLSQELEDQRATSEAERNALIQEHQQELQRREQMIQARLKQREQQMQTLAEARLREAQSKAAEQLHARELDFKGQLEAQAHALEARLCEELRQKEDSFSVRLKQREQQLQAQAEARVSQVQTQAGEQSRARELEFERQLENQAQAFEARMRQELQQKEEHFNARLKQREQQLQTQAEARLREAQSQAEEQLQARELEFERQSQAQARAFEARLLQELQQREEVFNTRLKQREQQLQLQAEARLRQVQSQAEEEVRARKLEFERQLETQTHALEARMREELQQKEDYYTATLKQREQELTARADSRVNEMQTRWAADLRAREKESESRTEARVNALVARVVEEAKQHEDVLQAKLRQREQQWQAKLEAQRAELEAQHEEAMRRRSTEAEAAMRELENKLSEEIQKKEETVHLVARQREQDLVAQLKEQWREETEFKLRSAVEPFKMQLARTEKERDEAKQSFTESVRYVQDLEKKLTEATSFLNAWRLGKSLNGAHG